MSTREVLCNVYRILDPVEEHGGGVSQGEALQRAFNTIESARRYIQGVLREESHIDRA